MVVPRLLLFVLAALMALASQSDLHGQTTAQKQKAQQLYTQAAKLEGSKQYAQAAEAMNEALKLVPKSDVYLGYAAKLEALAGKHAESTQHALEAAKINPKITLYVALVMKGAYESQDYDLAKDYAAKVIALGAKKIGQSYVDEAKTILASADARKADKLFEEAVALHRESKHAPAVDKMKEVNGLIPKNERFLAYLAELETLAARDAFDRHALQAPAEAEASIESLAKYLVQPAKDDRGKVRLIYRWMTDRVVYDAEGFFSGKRGDNSADGVLKNRKCVCEGYANLFEQLCKHAGVEAAKVSGYAKGYGYVPGQKISGSNHAWNAVKLEGKWHLLDSTWGAGHLSAKQFNKRFSEYYFLTRPEQFIYSHFPTDPQWQQLSPAIGNEEFQKWPKVDHDLFEFGVKADDIRAKLGEKTFRGFAEAFGQSGPRITVHAAPIDRFLAAGSKVPFRIEAAGFQEISVVNDGKWHALTKKGSVFEGTVTSQKGELSVSGKKPNEKTYWSILKYTVE